MNMTYCKSWFRAEKRLTEFWTEDIAKAAHESGKVYCVLFGNINKPFCFVEIGRGFVGVGFLDDLLREKLYYSFSRSRQGLQFLNMITHREFFGDSENVSNSTLYFFSENGEVKIIKRSLNNSVSEEKTVALDVSKNYERFPQFGKYGKFIIIER